MRNAQELSASRNHQFEFHEHGRETTAALKFSPVICGLANKNTGN